MLLHGNREYNARKIGGGGGEIGKVRFSCFLSHALTSRVHDIFQSKRSVAEEKYQFSIDFDQFSYALNCI